MICVYCTGNHHAMECPDLTETLIAIGVPPRLPAAPKMTPYDRRCRPWGAVTADKTLVENVLAYR